MLEKKKMYKRNILCMLFLATIILAGSVTVYAKTGTYSTKTVRGWSCTCKGEYVENTGRMTGSTKATFIEHPGCFTEAKAQDPFANKTYRSKKIQKKSVTIGGEYVSLFMQVFIENDYRMEKGNFADYGRDCYMFLCSHKIYR